MDKAAIVVATWNNMPFLVRTLESIRDYTKGQVDWRLIVTDNGSDDDTPKYLEGLKNQGVPITIIRNDTNVGFVRATNQGLRLVKEDEHVVLANDDIQIVEPYWLERMVDDLEDPTVGAVTGVSNYAMGLQNFGLSFQIQKQLHESHLIVYFCGLFRKGVIQKVGLLDERFGVGGSDDLDYSIRLHEAGYKILVDRTVFVYHFGSRTLIRTEKTPDGIVSLDKEKRAILIDKWGEKKVNWLFEIPDELKPEEDKDLYGESYYKRFGHGGYERNEFWLAEWNRIAMKIITMLNPRTVFDAGCAMGMLVEALVDQGRGGISAWGMDISKYAISHARKDIQDRLKVGSLAEPFTTESMDLVTCIEVLEHIPEEQAERAVGNLCTRTKAILFSSSPTDKEEPTHVNVRSRAYWVSLFGKFGFVPDESFDGSFLTPWTILFRRNY